MSLIELKFFYNSKIYECKNRDHFFFFEPQRMTQVYMNPIVLSLVLIF
ncbi:hypothetical protein E2C01_020054 [Portunus trituberculatus]|uniref:Uncharacterized protein n=1 Tax=Portunus trituberculatus TaxID=210409 RepID=A0A5B7E124_PORTR|nr:hypothetical protein [Portunus trituberculatus]